MLSCRDVTEQANDFIDGNLTSWQAMKVRLHILICKYCRRFVGQMQTVRQLAREYGSAPIDRATEDHLAGALHEHRRRSILNGDGQPT